MMRVLLVLATSLCVAMGVQVATQSALSAEALLKSATNREVVDRDLDGAADQYEQIAATFAANHAVASKALLQLGGIYERLGKPEAQAAYHRIVNDYPDTGATFTAALARLSAIQEATAGPFKSRSLDDWLKDAIDNPYVSPVALSPDGRYLAYPRVTNETRGLPDSQQQLGLFLRELANGRERVLAAPKPGEDDVNPVWSPDSRAVAYTMSGSNGEPAEYRVVTIASGESRTIGKSPKGPATFTWSPDARSLAFVVRPAKGPIEQHIVGMGTAGVDLGVADPTRNDHRPAWSPDSSRVAYAVAGDQTPDTIRIFTIATKASTSMSIPKASPSSRLSVLQWTARGEIEFSQSVQGGNDFFLVNPSGGAPVPICEGRGLAGGDMCGGLSPDGEWQITVKAASGGGRIVLRSTRDGSEHPLTPEATVEEPHGFSPDGRLLAFASNLDGSYAEYVAPLDQLPVAHPIKIAPLDSSRSAVTVRWTPTGLVLRVESNQEQLYRIDLDAQLHRPTAAPVRLTHAGPSNTGESISPDGHRIAYFIRGRPSGLALMDASGANERIVKGMSDEMLARTDSLGWLNSDEVLLTEAAPRADWEKVPLQLTAINVSTGQSRSAGPPLIGQNLYLLDGGNLLFEGADHRFHVRPLASAAPVRDVGEISGVSGMDDYKAVSRDGKWVAYATSDESGGKGKPVPGDIRLRSLETGSERVLVKYANSQDGVQIALDFSPDAKFLLYADPRLRLRILNVETGESWPALQDPPAGIYFDTDDGTSAHWSPDGSYVVVVGQSERTSWRAFEGVTHDAVIKILAAKK